MEKEAIICVDDEAVILLSIKQELKRKFRDRYLVEIALDATEAEALIADLEARGVRTVLVLSDWFMPGLRGDQFLIELHRKHPEIRTILVTGQADEESVERARIEAGLCACVKKPWRSSELARTIELCLAGQTPGCAG